MLRKLLCLLGFHKFRYWTAQEICPVEFDKEKNILTIKKGAIFVAGTGTIPEVKECQKCGAIFINGKRTKYIEGVK
jgi:hypothetical protein